MRQGDQRARHNSSKTQNHPKLWRQRRTKPLRLHNFLHNRVIGASPTAPPASAPPQLAGPPAAELLQGWSAFRTDLTAALSWKHFKLLAKDRTGRSAVLLSALLVALPVFVEAPWVRHAPFSAVLFTAVLLALGLGLAHSHVAHLRVGGEVLVGFSGSWLAGALFWGWARQYPICHLPIEALALPLALGGLSSRWRLACGFYLGSLLGTAATDAAIAATGLMPLWPLAVSAEPAAAQELLRQAANTLLHPLPVLLVSAFGLGLSRFSGWLWHRGPVARIAATALATTLIVDALFLALALLAPGLSGLI